MRDQNKREGVVTRQGGAGRENTCHGSQGRRPLREEVADIDQDILRLLMRRYNLLEKIRKKGRLDPAEEKFLRESWQNNVSRVSRNAELSGRFFSLMQDITFLPRPAAGGETENVPGPQRREAFNLAPPRRPVHMELTCPVDALEIRAWLYLAAAAGQPMEILHSPQNDPIVDCVKSLDQMGAAIAREESSITVRAAAPLGAPDKVIHLGDSLFNLYLLLAHYVGRHSRVKITGETSLKLADFSPLRHFLPELGARLVHIVPKSNGLPARLECSGMLPSGITIPPDLDADFIVALILAAPFYEKPFSIRMAASPCREQALAAALPLLENTGADFVLKGDTISIKPSPLKIPRKPFLAADPDICSFLLAFAAPLGGEVELDGTWPNLPDCADLWTAMKAAGLGWSAAKNKIRADKGISGLDLEKIPAEIRERVLERFLPILAGLAACAALANSSAALPWRPDSDTVAFFHAAGLECDLSGVIRPLSTITPKSWNAPTPQWAMALALAACARKSAHGFQLGNPGILTELWPSFWSIYNSLPDPSIRRDEGQENAPVKNRRRILTSVVATPPEIREEDW